MDTYIRSGTYGTANPKLPYTPGKDGAGIVQQVGDEVTKVKVFNINNCGSIIL